MQVEAEAVILATGYHYNFPFLTPECGVSVENRVVQPLYKHLISIANPSLSFIGLPVQVLFIGPMCTWGPIIGSPPPSLRTYKSFLKPCEYLVKTVNVVNVVKI